jgi:hypothetical protein
MEISNGVILVIALLSIAVTSILIYHFFCQIESKMFTCVVCGKLCDEKESVWQNYSTGRCLCKDCILMLDFATMKRYVANFLS